MKRARTILSSSSSRVAGDIDHNGMDCGGGHVQRRSARYNTQAELGSADSRNTKSLSSKRARPCIDVEHLPHPIHFATPHFLSVKFLLQDSARPGGAQGEIHP